jgi:RHS repeat-associated protein
MKLLRPAFLLICLLGAGLARAQAPSSNNTTVSANTTTSDSGNTTAPDTSLLSFLGAVDLTPVGGDATTDETASLTAAIQQYRDGSNREDFSPLQNFLTQYPQSAYTVGLLVNLGLLQYHYGYYSEALASYQQAWSLAQNITLPSDPMQQKTISAAGIRLAGLEARLGLHQQLNQLLAALEPYPKWGTDKTLYEQSLQGAAMMTYKPGKSFNCGPYALVNIARANPGLNGNIALLLAANATPDVGFSLAQLQTLAQAAGMNYVAASRAGNTTAIPLPAVVHWNAGHYAAVLAQNNGLYLVKDPTFGTDFWMSATALNTESSGNFLIPATDANGDLPQGWSALGDAGAAIFGRGAYIIQNPQNQPPPQCPCGTPMAQVSFDMFEAKAYVTDTPVAYTPPYGPAISFQLSYYEGEEEGQVAPNTTTVGNTSLATWTLSYLSAVYDTDNANDTVSLLSSDGTEQTYFYISTANLTTANYTGNVGVFSGAVMERAVNSGNVSYIQHFPDGSATTYGKKVAGSSGNYFLLSSMADPQNNTVTFSYDGSNRLATVTDALGQSSTVGYANGTTDYVSNITDPFGREASFGYNATTGILANITDPGSIESNFTYTSGNLATVTTPYGTTTITGNYSNISTITGYNGSFMRLLLITDPTDAQECVVYGDPLYYNYGNGTVIDRESQTLFFNKHVISVIAGLAGAPSNFSNISWVFQSSGNLSYWQYYATTYAWPDSNDYGYATGVPEDVYIPFNTSENYEIEYDYSTAGNKDNSGTPIMSQPDYVDNGCISEYTYNSLGNPATLRDGVNRETIFGYNGTNGIDIMNVTQTYYLSGNNYPVQQFGNYTNHLPGSMVDISNVTTTYTYNGTTGQLTQAVRNSGSSPTLTTTYGYTGGYLTSVTANGTGISGTATLVSKTYSNGLLQSQTDARGFTANYTYDNLQRVTAANYTDGTYETWSYTANIDGSNISALSLGSYTDRNGHTTTYTYDGDGHETSMTDGGNRTTTYDWCGCGALDSITDADGHTTNFNYDLAGHIISRNITVGGNTETYSYTYSTGTNQVASVTLPSNATITYMYNGDGTTSTITYNGTNAPPAVSYYYDQTFPLLTMVYDNTDETDYNYVPVGSAGALQVANATVQAYGYVPFNTMDYSYDAFGRRTGRTLLDASGNTTQSETYSYDALGRMTGLGGNLGSFTMAYNGNSSELASVAYPNGMNTTLGYFPASAGAWLANITNNVTSGGNTTLFSQFNYTHLGDGTIATWQQSFGWAQNITPANITKEPVQQQLYVFGYDGSGWLTNATLGAPQASDSSTLQDTYDTWTYAYDGSGNRLTSNISGNDAANTTSTVTGNFGGDNSLNYLVRSGRTNVAGYVDKPGVVTVNELPTRQWSLPGGRNFAFDSSLPTLTGNGNTANITIDAVDAVGHETKDTWQVPTGNTAANFTYDANGDTLAEVDNPSSNLSVASNYTWSSIGQLLSVQTGNTTVAFTYDCLGHRIELSANVSGNVSTEYYIWDGDQIVQKMMNGNTTANITAKYFDYGFQAINGNSSTNYFYTTDHQGSIREVLANDGQTIVGRFSYDPWGDTTYEDYSAGSVAQPDFGYDGYFRSSHLPGLYLTEYRPYCTIIGKWLSRDPIGEAGGLNLYGYVGNNPINFRDPLGLDAAAAAEALGGLGTAEEGEEAGGWLAGGNFNPVVDGAMLGTAIIGGGYALWEYFQPTSVCMSNSGERGIQGKDPNPWKGYRPKDPKDPSKGGQKQDPQTGKWKPVPRPQGPPPPNHPTW